jgi:hypothetical protein
LEVLGGRLVSVKPVSNQPDADISKGNSLLFAVGILESQDRGPEATGSRKSMFMSLRTSLDLFWSLGEIPGLVVWLPGHWPNTPQIRKRTSSHAIIIAT